MSTLDRRAGVLLHISSLPTGRLGRSAHDFVDWLAKAGVGVWQVLPLVPTHDGDGSPYNAISAMAGNPDLIDLEGHDCGEDQAAAFQAGSQVADLNEWAWQQNPWLLDFADYVVLRRLCGDQCWVDWPAALRDRQPSAIRSALVGHEAELQQVRFEQYTFHRQWSDLRQHAESVGVQIFGDLPIFVSLDSADVWAHRNSFLLDEAGRPSTVTGVPPDYFAADGQMWNNPHYDWAAMEADGFAWWRARIASQRKLFDLVRIDHFRGLEAAWHIEAGAETAKDGWWQKSPGDKVLAALVDESGEGTLIAEDLGLITPEVEALRARWGLPGMKVLQFAFDGDPDNFYLPANFGVDAVAYTGTHDNDTTVGWWNSLDEPTQARVRAEVRSKDGGREMPWPLIELALTSRAGLAVIPAQDILGLGSQARMNTPGTAEGNWTWRSEPGDFDEDLADRLRALIEASGRAAPTPSSGRLGTP